MSGGEKGEEGIGSAAAGGKRDSTLRKKTEPAHMKGDSPKMRRLSVRAAEQKRGDTPQEERVPRIAEERTAVRAAGRRGGSRLRPANRIRRLRRMCGGAGYALLCVVRDINM